MILKADFLVIGTGIAGLTYAIKAAERYSEKKVLIVSKSEAFETNTRYAQGGIASVWNTPQDCFQKHYNDTMSAGDYINDPAIVELVIKGAPERVQELIDWGVEFDKKKDGSMDLCLEGGHSERRILHCKDTTGSSIENALLKKLFSLKNITVLSHHFAVDLITKENKCFGVDLINLKTLGSLSVFSNYTMLATGGIGQVYKNTTNPVIATGDGIAMAIRAGAEVEDMEFIQFHPTALYAAKDNPAFLISEAVRGLGAVLKNKNGKEFMYQYSSQGSLAPRDVVARGIFMEMNIAKEKCVYLDCSSIEEKEFKAHFPTIYEKCHSLGINVPQQPIPVVPAAHYVCGGIKTNKWGETTIRNLYASGECARTGLHGANRLASNSLLEALVFSHASFIHTSASENDDSSVKIFVHKPDRKNYLDHPDLSLHLKHQINDVVSENLGIIRNRKCIASALHELETLHQELLRSLTSRIYSWQRLEVNNLITIAKEISKASIRRTENRGLFYSANNEISASHNTLVS